jgi:hypothetical protein
MPPITVSTAQLASLERLVRSLVRAVRRLAFASVLGALAIALLLWRDDGFDELDAVLTLLLLTPAAILLFFTRAVLELVSLPARLQRLPGEGQERLAELTRVAGDTRTVRPRNAPLLLWRLRRSVGSLRDVAGIALPFRVFTPGFLGLTALAGLACLALIGFALVALVVLAVG